MSSSLSTSSSSMSSRSSTRMSSVATPESTTYLTDEIASTDDQVVVPPEVKYIEDMDGQERFKRLSFLLEKSSAYANILHSQMDVVKSKSKETNGKNTGERSAGKRGRGRGRRGLSPPSKRRKVVESDDEEISESKESHEKAGETHFQQPPLLSGGILKDYQLDGVAWMVSLYENGISGILADEMGLGKTIQVIAFCAYLRERVFSPFLIVCPLSVLHNWIDEFKKFAPDIPVCMYHGTPEHRKILRRTVMRPILEETEDEDSERSEAETPSKKRRSHHRRRKDESTQPPKSFPVIITTYEMIIKDRLSLASYNWGYIVVDEGHRLKNFNCKLVQEIKKYSSASRLILTGTPLHNNLGELWSLLNFILPDIFSDLSVFQTWFSTTSVESSLSSDQSAQLVTTLHSILKPFLLRRMKADVDLDLPPKKEYIIYAPMTQRQKSIYEAIVKGGIRRFLIDTKQSQSDAEYHKRKKTEELERLMREGRQLRKREGNCFYNVDDEGDEEYFKRMESSHNDKKRKEIELGSEFAYKKAIRQVNNMKLQNTVMQCRKVCSHPFLFDWPLDPFTNQQVVNEELVLASGKMLVLDRLLTELFRRKHKVLLFSQFTTMLDIIEDWAIEFKGWRLCRIDGSTGPNERRDRMREFQEGEDSSDAPILFLLSTRAGGLGVNLTAADTVIFYDQDWNPQMDAQAQDRAHRIGQKRPVLVFRLVTAHTIEQTVLQRATEKRKLEALVIAKGKFKIPGSLVTTGKEKESLAEIAASLLELESEKINVVQDEDAGKTTVISDKELDLLLDRSPAVFAERKVGWRSAPSEKLKRPIRSTETLKATAFEVFESKTEHDGNNGLATIMGEPDTEDTVELI